jgi:hypothetical protein
MALIKCENCGQDVSDRAIVCPHCKAVLKENVSGERSTLICEECGAEIPDGKEVCPHCGFPVEHSKKAEMLQPVETKMESPIITVKRTNRSKQIILCVVIAALLIIGFVWGSQNILTGDDKVAYELILEAADNFKDPSSVRLSSGTVGVDKDCLFCGISATNSYGARSTSYYFVMSTFVLEEDSPTSLYKATDKLNISKINKKLEKALKNTY